MVNRLADCARERIHGPWAGPVDVPSEHSTTVDLAWAIDGEPVSQPQFLGEAVSPAPVTQPSKFPYRYQPGGRQRRVRWAGLTHQISQGFGPVQLTGSRSSTPL